MFAGKRKTGLFADIHSARVLRQDKILTVIELQPIGRWSLDGLLLIMP